MTEMEKMEAGLEYTFADDELRARYSRAVRWCEEFNAIDGTDYAAQYEHLKQMLGAVGEGAWIAKNFRCDCGRNIFIGNDFSGNYNLTILDIREVHIGNNVMIGPNTLITTVGHPLSPQKRRCYMAQAEPVTIGNDVSRRQYRKQCCCRRGGSGDARRARQYSRCRRPGPQDKRFGGRH